MQYTQSGEAEPLRFGAHGKEEPIMSPLITAHSGADGLPDNSLEYVRHALATQADALEVDVRPGSGGNLVISHDAGQGDVPLREVFSLAAAHPTMKLNCDLKVAGLEEQVLRLADTFGLAGRLIYSGTVSAHLFAKSSRLRESVQVYLNVEEYVPDLYRNYRDIPDFELQAAARMADVCHETGIRVINMFQGLVTRRFIEFLAGEGIGVSAWTVNDPQELDWFLERNVTNITTRNLRQALAMRERRAKGRA